MSNKEKKKKLDIEELESDTDADNESRDDVESDETSEDVVFVESDDSDDSDSIIIEVPVAADASAQSVSFSWSISSEDEIYEKLVAYINYSDISEKIVFPHSIARLAKRYFRERAASAPSKFLARLFSVTIAAHGGVLPVLFEKMIVPNDFTSSGDGREVVYRRDANITNSGIFQIFESHLRNGLLANVLVGNIDTIPYADLGLVLSPTRDSWKKMSDRIARENTKILMAGVVVSPIKYIISQMTSHYSKNGSYNILTTHRGGKKILPLPWIISKNKYLKFSQSITSVIPLYNYLDFLGNYYNHDRNVASVIDYYIEKFTNENNVLRWRNYLSGRTFDVSVESLGIIGKYYRNIRREDYMYQINLGVDYGNLAHCILYLSRIRNNAGNDIKSDFIRYAKKQYDSYEFAMQITKNIVKIFMRRNFENQKYLSLILDKLGTKEFNAIYKESLEKQIVLVRELLSKETRAELDKEYERIEKYRFEINNNTCKHLAMRRNYDALDLSQREKHDIFFQMYARFSRKGGAGGAEDNNNHRIICNNCGLILGCEHELLLAEAAAIPYGVPRRVAIEDTLMNNFSKSSIDFDTSMCKYCGRKIQEDKTLVFQSAFNHEYSNRFIFTLSETRELQNTVIRAIQSNAPAKKMHTLSEYTKYMNSYKADAAENRTNTESDEITNFADSVNDDILQRKRIAMNITLFDAPIFDWPDVSRIVSNIENFINNIYFELEKQKNQFERLYKEIIKICVTFSHLIYETTGFLPGSIKFFNLIEDPWQPKVLPVTVEQLIKRAIAIIRIRFGAVYKSAMKLRKDLFSYYLTSILKKYIEFREQSKYKVNPKKDTDRWSKKIIYHETMNDITIKKQKLLRTVSDKYIADIAEFLLEKYRSFKSKKLWDNSLK